MPEPSPDAWGYRPGLDGLRTVAIYLVVLFHAGLGRMGNGYLGVDVFFVLSGFLVTNVMANEHRETGRLRLGRFYARRVRRLLPAAVVLVVSVCALSLLVLPKLTRAGFVSDARASLLYVGNWHFLGAATDYFADDVGRSPFLHFWSLAIEEQFYVVYPLVLLGALTLAARRRRAALVPLVLGGLLVASLIAQIVVARSSTLDAYYGTHTRLYQLLAGGTLAAAWRVVRRRRDASAVATATSGAPTSRRWLDEGAAAASLLALVLLATDAVELSVSTRGIAATLAAVVLVAAVERTPASVVGRVLGRPTMTYLGKISYGTYLWHWPIIVLAREVVDLSPGELAAVAGIGATAMAALSFQLLETPIRRTAHLARRPRLVVAIGLSCSVVVALTAVPALLRSDRRPAVAAANGGSFGPTGDAALDAALAASPPADLDLAATEPPVYDEGSCVAAEPETCIVHRGSGAHLHLIGDSNAIVVIPLFLRFAEEHDLTLSVTARVGCPWQDGLSWVTDNDALTTGCAAARHDWYERTIPALDPDVVVAVHVPRDAGSRADGSVFVAAEAARDGDDIDDVVAAATESSVDRLTSNGARVVLLEPLPYDTDDPTECLSGAATVGACAYEANAEPFPTELVYRAVADARDDVVDVDADRLACPFLPICVPMIDGELVFRNQFHLSNAWFLDHAATWWELLAGTGVFDGLTIT